MTGTISRTINVLVVDDLKLIHEGLKIMLTADNDINLVGFAENGKEAIEHINNAEQKPDVVLVDILMPVMDGMELTKVISKKFPEIKVIVLSSSEDDATILKAIALGAKGYLLKNTIARDLTSAIHSVYRGSAHFSPGIVESLAETARKDAQANDAKKLALQSGNTSSIVRADRKPSQAKKAAKAKAKPKPQKPLFEHGDWLTIILGVIVLSQTNGMGHHLAHAGLFFLMLSLIARPIKKWWSAPLKHRRAIGIFAFAAAVAHALYATFKVLDFDFEMMLAMSARNKWGIAIGVISLLAMTPAAVTSFQFFQKKLGKKWRQIHLLTVPSLALAVLHTVLVGPHYMATPSLTALDYIRIFGAIVGGILVLLMRKKAFWTTLKLDRSVKKPTAKNQKVLTGGKVVGKHKKNLVET